LGATTNALDPGLYTSLLIQGNGFTINGITGGEANRVLIITEGSAGGSTFAHNSGSASAANRMILQLAGSVTLAQWHSMILIYNATDALWYQLGQRSVLV
jgi:hypothetical protein